MVVGEATLGECLEKGLLHRAIAVLVIRSNGKALLQERSREDFWQPGRWTLSSTGHVRRGENYQEAGERELSEELGLRARLSFVGKFHLPPITDGKLTEHEWVSLFTADTDDETHIDRTEVHSVAEADLADLEAGEVSRPLTEDANFLLREFLRRRRRGS